AQGQKALLSSKVVIVGAGGLGGPVAMYLAAAGVGKIDIIDGDRVELSNLQRQVQFDADQLAEFKSEMACARASAINPTIDLRPVTENLSALNADKYIASADLVIEGIDSFEDRFMINNACVSSRKPFLSGAVGRFEGQLALFDVSDKANPCYQCLVPEAPPAEEQMTCEEEGVLGPLTGVVGSLMALEAIKFLAGVPPSLAGNLLRYNALEGTIRRVRIHTDPACPNHQ
ncbi:MAG: HesA/MoeB/ThiF family protein, partial [Pseudomonadota bacterium]